MKKLISIVLSFAMILTMCAYPAYAETTSEGVINEVWSDYVSVSFNPNTGVLDISNYGTADIFNSQTKTSIDITQVKTINIDKFETYYAEMPWWSYFTNCTSINVTDDNNHISIDGVVYSSNKYVIYAYPVAKNAVSSYTVDSQTGRVYYNAFKGALLRQLSFSGKISNFDSNMIGEMPFIESIVFEQAFENDCIDEDTFLGMPSLQSIEVASDDTYYETEDGVLYNKGKTRLIKCPACKDVGIYTFPASVTSIEPYAFEYSRLTGVVISQNIKSIGGFAFKDCSNLKNVLFDTNSNLTFIGVGAFRNCISIESIEIPAGVVSLSGTFYGCSKLNSIAFETESSLNSIKNAAFYECDSLTSIDIPASVETIGDNSFAYCDNLSRVSFESGSKLTTIEHQAFYNCSMLTSIDIPANVTTIRYDAFTGARISDISFGSLQAFNAVSQMGNNGWYLPYVTEIDVPDELTEISSSTFRVFSNLTTLNFSDNSKLREIGYRAFFNKRSITTINNLPSSLMVIGSEAFYNTSISNIELPEGLQSIGSYAFEYSYNLEEINIPASVTYISYEAFDSCNNLSSVSFDGVGNTDLDALTGTRGLKIDNRAFYSCDSLVNLVLPRNVTYLGEDAFGYCNNLKTVNIEAGDADKWYTIIRGSFARCYNLESFTANGHVIGISYNSFIDDYNLKTFDAGQTQTEETGLVRARAFYNCRSLETLVLPETINGIDIKAFIGCDSLKNVDIPEKAEYIRDAFSNLNLETITGMEGVTRIGNYAFRGNKNLTSLPELNSLESIGKYSFAYSGLAELNLPKNVRAIGYGAFRHCDNLNSINLNNGNIEKIYGKAFTKDQLIENVEIPSTVRYLGYHAFNIKNLKVNIIPDSENKLPNTYFAFSRTARIKYPCTSDTSSFVSRGFMIPEHNFVLGTCTECGKSEKQLNSEIIEVKYPKYKDTDEDRGYTQYMYPIDAGNMQYIVLDIYEDYALVEGLAYYEEAPASVTIPDMINGVPVTTIIDHAFSGETALTELVLGRHTTVVGSGSLEGSGITSITVPMGCTFIDAETVPSTLTDYTFIEGASYGDYDCVTHKDTPWYKNRNNITGITISEGVTAIPAYMFADMKIKELDIPESVNKVGDNAFYRNYELTKVTGAEGLENIGYEAFADCEALKSMPLSSTITKIRYNSFAGCEALVAIVESGSYAQEAVNKYGIGYRVGEIGSVVNPNPSSENISVASVYANTNSTVTVYVNLNSNPGLTSMLMQIEYDETALELVTAENGDAVETGFTSNGNKMAWENSETSSNITSTGKLVKLTFNVKGDAAGRYEIKALCKDARDKDGNYVELTSASGVVAVSPNVCGDVTGTDGAGYDDSIYILKYLLGVPGFKTIDKVAADVNLDGDINLADIMAINRTKAGWDGYSLPYVS